MKSILVTGGAGFIGSNFIRYLFGKTPFSGRIINLDKLTYAGNPESLADVRESMKDRYIFVQGDICDAEMVGKVFSQYEIDTVCHFAAESHVDRSIHGPKDFIETNVTGTFTLLEAARTHWKDRNKNEVRFHHVSTDEVYGSLGETGYFFETTPYDPRSPYSASKASSDHIARAYNHTYGLPVTISNCSNNYGPYQFPEKLIPVVILNAVAEKPLPVYGEGKNVRDWLHVDDHNSAIWAILTKGKPGETYNIGGECEKQNIQLVRAICKILDEIRPRPGNKPHDELITYVKDRPGHDLRYAINCDKIKKELGWSQSVTFEAGLRSTVEWYLANTTWIQHIQSGEYRKWMETNYQNR